MNSQFLLCYVVLISLICAKITSDLVTWILYAVLELHTHSINMNLHTRTGNRIPEDLMREILRRLPVKSLMRFKSVSKSWLNLISSEDFIDSQLKCRNGDDETLVFCRKDDNSVSLLLLDSPLPNEVPLGLPSLISHSFEPLIKIVGTFNGIICLSVSICPKKVAVNYDLIDLQSGDIFNPNLYIWNPVTNQSKLLPRPHLRDSILGVCFGFGFDPVGNDFKVVRIVNSLNNSYSVEVFSVQTNVWQNLDCRTYAYPVFDEFDVCLHGFLCCTGNECMISVDLSRDNFSCGLKLPTVDYGDARYVDVRITEHYDSLAVIASKEKNFKHNIKLWKLLDESCLVDTRVEAVWTQMFSIRVSFPVWRVYGCFNADVLMNTENAVWLLYNKDKKVARRRKLPVTLFETRQLFKFNASLIQITPSSYPHESNETRAHRVDRDTCSIENQRGVRTRSLVANWEKKDRSPGHEGHASSNLSGAVSSVNTLPVNVEMEPGNEEDAISALMEPHNQFVGSLQSRLAKLEMIHKYWERNDIKGAIGMTQKMSDNAVLADIVSILTEKPDIVTLDICTCVLPLLASLLESEMDWHQGVSLELLIKLVRVFGSVIYSSLSASSSVGVDIEAEQRLERCNLCYVELEKVKRCLPVLTRKGGAIAKSAHELSLALQEVS